MLGQRERPSMTSSVGGEGIALFIHLFNVQIHIKKMQKRMEQRKDLHAIGGLQEWSFTTANGK